MHCGRAWLICGLLESSFVGAQQAPADRQEDASDFAEEETPASLAAKLLDCDRPASNWAEVLNARIKAGEPLPAWPGAKAPPSDDADPARHLAYWRERLQDSDKARPGPAARVKLLAAVTADPSALGGVLRLLPETEGAARQVAGLLGRPPALSKEDQASAKEARAWVYRHGGLMRDLVIEDAKRADWERYVFNERPDWALDALQRRDPEQAARVFAELAAGPDPGLATVAARLLLEKATPQDAPQWREQLIAAAGNAKFPEPARQIAVEALLNAKWKGREAWVRSFLAQADAGTAGWFCSEVDAAPGHWIPILARMVGGENRRAHEAAVSLLARFNGRADALRPLLPWLVDPQWGGEQPDYIRFAFFRGLEEVRLPEAVPGLQRVLAEDSDDSVIGAAALALAHHGAKDAVPAMKEALARDASVGSTDEIVGSIHRLGGYPHAEMVAGLEAYFNACPNEEAQRELDDKARDQNPGAGVWAGRYFAKSLPDQPALRDAIRQRAASVAEHQAQLAANLRGVLLQAKAGDKSALLATMLSEGNLPAEQLASALHQCAKSGWRGTPFRRLLDGKGATGAFAAVLVPDPKAMAAILKGGDAAAQEALLAAAMHAGTRLDLERVAVLLDSENDPLAQAAKDYLTSLDDPQARRLWVAHGQKKDGDAGVPGILERERYGEFDAIEKQARKEFSLAAGPEEIYVLNRSAEGGCQGRWLVLVYSGTGIAVRDFGQGRTGSCRLTEKQLGRVRGYVRKYRVDDLPRLEQPIIDGVSYSYVHATKDGIRRVFMNNPPTGRSTGAASCAFGDEEASYSKGIVIYGQLVNLFDDLFAEADLKFGYGNGVEILIPREKANIRTVWKNGDDLRVLVERTGSSGVWQRVSLATRSLTGMADEPAACPVLAAKAALHPKFSIYLDHLFRYPWQVRAGDATVHSGSFGDVKGLWLCRSDREPELIAMGEFAGELVTPDGKWCVAAKAAGAGWAAPNGAVRIDLTTKEELPIALPDADNFDTLGFVAARGKFLVRRLCDAAAYGRKDRSRAGPEKPELHLVDPATGVLEPLEGEFWFPKYDLQFRPLQAASTDSQVWAADGQNISGGGISTEIVRHDTKNFTRHPVKTIQGIAFDSMDMWVDEAGGMIYAAANGDLVRVPLAP